MENKRLSDADLVAPKIVVTEEAAKAEFTRKNGYIAYQDILELYEVKDADEYIQLLFGRDNRGEWDVMPYEDVDSEEYRMWREQKAKEVKTIDYSGYACWRYNPIIFYIDGKEVIREGGKRKTVKKCRHKLVLNGAEPVARFVNGRQFALMSPVTYVGRNNNYDNARYLYAFAFDLDGVGLAELDRLFTMMANNNLPLANLITSSGHGLHLYYLLEYPVAMFEGNRDILNKMKRGLTNLLWNQSTSNDANKQYQGVIQGFRIPGTLTKFGEKVRTWAVRDAPMWNVSQLNEYLSEFKLSDDDVAVLESGKPHYNPTSVTLEEAKRRWPEWYVAKIINKEKVAKPWNVNRAVYDWWLNRLRTAKESKDSEIKLHHRYWCILTLVIYGVKCNVPKEEVRQDGYSLVSKMDLFSESETNRFTHEDVDDAMLAYDKNYNTWPIREIEKVTQIRIKRNRRNGRCQALHLAGARALQHIYTPNWRNKDGRPKGSIVTAKNSKHYKAIQRWRKQNPGNDNKSRCARELGISRPTVHKWW